MKRLQHLQETEDLSMSLNAKERDKDAAKDKDLPDSIRGLISLDSHTVRYLNKRKPSDKTNSAYTLHASRANVVMLQPIFEGLPSYSDGTITLHDLNEAIYHLSKPQKERVAIFNDPRVTSAFFRDLDLRRSGTINFREFALGMANYPGHSSLTAIEIMRLKDAFQEYSSSKRREQIIKESADSTNSDARKFSELKKLLFLTSSRIADLSNRDDDYGTRESKMLTSMFIESPRSKSNRRKASLRAKEAKLFLDGEKNGRKNSSTLSNSLSRDFQNEVFVEKKPRRGSTINSPVLYQSKRLSLIINNSNRIEMEEREENIDEEVKEIKKELQLRKSRKEEKERQNEIQDDSVIKMIKEKANVSFDEIISEEKKFKYKHPSMNGFNNVSRRKSNPISFPNIKSSNPVVVVTPSK